MKQESMKFENISSWRREALETSVRDELLATWTGLALSSWSGPRRLGGAVDKVTLGQLQTRPLKVDAGNVKKGKMKGKKLRKSKCQNTPVILQQDNQTLLNNG